VILEHSFKIRLADDSPCLLAATHGWVNAEFMLDGCMVGFLVPEPDPDSD